MSEQKKKGRFARLREGLSKTRRSIASGFASVFSGFSAIDDDFYEELEEILIMGDLGVHTTEQILERLKEQGSGPERGCGPPGYLAQQSGPGGLSTPLNKYKI